MLCAKISMIFKVLNVFVFFFAFIGTEYCRVVTYFHRVLYESKEAHFEHTE